MKTVNSRSALDAGWGRFGQVLLLSLFIVASFPRASAAGEVKNFFINPGFELGREGWRLDKAGKTEGQFTVENQDAAEGQASALISIGSVDAWGIQFGQSFAAGKNGKTYTFAAMAKCAKGVCEVGLQIERSAKPWDRAASGRFKLGSDWQELHITFTVEKDFPEGWFAYLSCTQPKVGIQADMFRLYEGAYVPFKEAVQEEATTAAARLFDTGKHSSTPLAGDAVAKRTGWKEVPEDKPPRAFKGDGVLLNDRLAVILRRGAPGAEVYSLGPARPALRAVLVPTATSGVPQLSSWTVIENNSGAGVAEASFKATGGKTLTLRYQVKAGQPFVQTEVRGGVTGLRLEAPCRFLVMPDFFADDIVIDAASLPVSQADLPSDNLLLHLLPDRQAMVMSVVKTSEEDIRVAVSGQGDRRQITSSELRFGRDGKIWVGVLSAPAIWHEHTVVKTNAGQVLQLDWRPPYPAQWRVDWRRADELTDSWDMIRQRPDGIFVKPVLFGSPDTIPANRQRWTTVLGSFSYPAWIDCPGQAFLQPLKSTAVCFEGPAVIYPLSRAPGTALDTFTVLDIVRNTLGVGPCEYILDVENQQSRYQGRATCSVRDLLNPIYAAKEQKQRRAEIEQALVDLMIFIRHIRGRIEDYVAFGHETLAYLAEQKRAHPELAGQLAELETMARRIDERFAARAGLIKTPDEVANLVLAFRQTVLDYEGEDALAKCQQFTGGWVVIGGNQDELVGECRWAVKMIRQKAGLMMAVDARLAEVAKELRRRSQIVLRNPAGHEGARH